MAKEKVDVKSDVKVKAKAKPAPKLKSGMVSIVGRPNVGKSTLLNAIIGEKVAIVSDVPQTTRNQIRGIYTEERGQIVFIDTPGVNTGYDLLGKMMSNSSTSTIDEVDCLIYLVDVSRRIGEEEEFIAQRVKDAKVPVILGLNKVDVKNNYLSEYIAFWERIKGKPVGDLKKFALIAMSGKKETNVDKLIDLVFDFLPKGEALYPEDIISDVPQKMAIADIIREKFLHIMREELPHSIGVVIEDMQVKRNKVVLIKAVIFVERPTQKEIVIGTKGKILKEVGTLARHEIEKLLEKKVFLELLVRLEEGWRDNVELLQEFGYSSQNE